jgi:putative transposase
LEYQRKSTKPKDIAYSLYLFYFLGLSYRNTAKALQRLVRRSHVSILKWIQKYRLKKIFLTKTKVSEFIIDETPIKVGSELIWLLVVAIEPTHSKILHIDISFERTMLVAERFIAYLIDKHGKHDEALKNLKYAKEIDKKGFLKSVRMDKDFENMKYDDKFIEVLKIMTS